MKSYEKFKGRYYHRDLGCFCPQCYKQFPFGDVQIKVKINFDKSFPQEALRVRGALAINQEAGSQDESTLVRVRCPWCGENMIVIDDSLRELVVAFNEQCFFTKWSCEGHYPNVNSSGSIIPYISFFDANIINGFNEYLTRIHPCLKVEEDAETEDENAFIFIIQSGVNPEDHARVMTTYPGIESLRFVYQENDTVDMEFIPARDLKNYSTRELRDSFKEAAESYLRMIIDNIDEFVDFDFNVSPDDKMLEIIGTAAALLQNYRRNPNNFFTLKNRIEQEFYGESSYIDGDINFDIADKNMDRKEEVKDEEPDKPED